MSTNGELILDQIPDTSELSNPNNPMYRIIDDGVGAWLDNFEERDLDSQLFLNTSTGKYLDLHGKDFNIRRKPNESDEDYRQRIIYESMGEVTVGFLLTVYNVELYAFVDDFHVEDNTLTSDNPYISDNGFLAVSNQTTKDILDKKFILDTKIEWLIL